MTYVLKASGLNGSYRGDVWFNGQLIGEVSGSNGRAVRKNAKAIAAAHKAESAIHSIEIVETFSV